jgi:hypothetical protein
MNSINNFKLRGIFEFPLGIIAYLYPQLFPVAGLDTSSIGVQFVIRFLGVCLITLFTLGYFVSGLPSNDPNRRSISLVLSGYHGTMVSLLLSSRGILDVPVFSWFPWEFTLAASHSYFAYIFYSEYSNQVALSGNKGADHGTNTKL